MSEELSRSFTLFALKKYWEILSFVVIVLFYLLGTFFFVLFRNEVQDVVWSNSFRPPCCRGHPGFSVNISSAEEDADGNLRTEGLVYPPGTFYKFDGSVFGCPCLLKPCVRKCCKADEKFDLDSEEPVPPCVQSNSTSFKPFRRNVYTSNSGRKEDLQLKFVQEDHFVFLHGNVCVRGDYFLNEIEYGKDRNFLMEDGRLIIYDPLLPFPLDQSQYCLESFLGDDTIHAVACYMKSKKDTKSKQDGESSKQCQEQTNNGSKVLLILSVAAMTLSIVFLVLTLIVLFLLSKVRKSHGTCLMCYIVSLAVAFGALNILQYGRNVINTEKHKSICVGLALLVQYAYISSLLWLNVMGFDIWCRFRNTPRVRDTTRPKSCKGFIYRCIYAFGLPLIITLTTVAMEVTIENSASIFKPNIGFKRNCWFKEGAARWMYFFCPIAIILTANTLMFLTTVCRIHSQDKQSAKDLQSGSPYYNRNKLWISLKLFSIMGLFWVLEPVSYYVGKSSVYEIVLWVFDMYNALQGVVIFYLCVGRQPDLMKHFKGRFHPEPARRESMVTFRSSVSSSVETRPL